jgi:6-phosphogluconolactonase
MHRILATLAAVLGALVVAGAAMAAPGPGAVYTLTNGVAANAVAAFDRGPDGSLSPQGTFATGGRGTGGGLGSQGAVILSENGERLFAVNAGSNSVSAFAVRPHGLELVATVPSGGVTPTSVTQHGRYLYVLNAGGAGNIAGFTIAGAAITPLATQPLGTRTFAPAQVQFSPDGSSLVVTGRTSNTIDVYAVDRDGYASAPVTSASAGGTPFGFDFDKRGNLLVSEAATGSASSYAIGADGVASLVSGVVATHQGAPCWLVASKNGEYAYTANAGSGTISGFAVGHDGSLSLLDETGVTANLGAGSHPLDEAVSNDGRFLYNLTDGRHEITAFRIGDDGSLEQVGSIDGLPAGAAGIAAR